MKLYEHQRINRQDLRGHCKEVNMVEITKNEAASLAELIGLYLFSIIRDDIEINSMEWLCNMVSVYEKCKACAEGEAK